MREIKTLHEVCDTVGVTRRAVQGYEKRGLVAPSGKNKYGYLLYDSEAQERIALIKRYQRLGFKLKDVECLIDAPNSVVKEALIIQVIKLQEDSYEKKELIKLAEQWIDSLSD
ncbi:MAG: MerR family transcriptional regulator [Lachnospiraceae bacterium]|nr:MerR family transcriptional regulator [Lachnospiraceae bacterium]